MSTDPRGAYAIDKLRDRLNAKMTKAKRIERLAHEISTVLLAIGASLWVGYDGGSALEIIVAYCVVTALGQMTAIASTLRSQS